jgi:hypothetical protein
MRLILTSLIAVLIAVTALGLAPSPADAHERRQVGPYSFVVGFQGEPAYVEEPNGTSLAVSRDGQPVEGVDKTLKVEVTTGGDSRTFDLKPVFNRPGSYVAEFIPTKSGPFAFRFFGKIENLDVNERFESGPNRFDEVKSKKELQFPAAVPTNGELAAQVQQARPAEGSPSAGAPTAAELQQALDRADSARTTAFVVGGAGILFGLLGLGLAALALAGRRRNDTHARHEPEPI